MLNLPPVIANAANPPERVGLPCPDADLIALVTLIGNRKGKFTRLIRSNPSLLLFCVAQYSDQHAKPPKRWKQLIKWCEKNLLDAFTEREPGWSQQSPGQHDFKNGLEASLKKFAQSDSNLGLKKSLVKFLVATSQIKKAKARVWVDRIVGRQFKLRPIETAPQFMQESMQDRWFQSSFDSIDVERIFDLRKSHDLNESKFRNRLLDEKLASMKQLAYGASHEINNPLANISTRAQTLLSDETHPERRSKLATIYEQAMRAHEMISDMMLFANPPKVELLATDVRLLFSKLVKELQPNLVEPPQSGLHISRPPIDLQVRIGPEISNVVLDSTQMCVAIRALIHNSIEGIRSTGNPGTIVVHVGKMKNGKIHFSVADDGAGIIPEAKPHLFDPFYSGREAGRGLGFGLSKAWRIAQLHGGNLRLDDRHHPGAKFVLSLPSKHQRVARHQKTSAA